MTVAAYLAAVNTDAPDDLFYLDDAAGPTLTSVTASHRTLATNGPLIFGVDGPLGAANGNYSLYFNGSGAYLGGTSFNEFSPSQVGWEMWIRPGYGTSLGVILHARTDGYGLQLDNAQVPDCWAAINSTRTLHVPAAVNLMDGFWHHLYWYWSGSVLAIWLDGIEYASVSQVGPINIYYGSAPSEQFFVGSDQGTSGFFVGSLAMLACYRTVTLSPARILAHAQALGYVLQPPGPPATTTNLAASFAVCEALLNEILASVRKSY